MPENKSTVLKQVTSILIETGIQMLKIVKDLNKNDQLYKKQETEQTEKGAKNDSTENTKTGTPQIH